MCNNNWGGGIWILILILLIFCGGFGCNNDCGCNNGCNNGCGC